MSIRSRIRAAASAFRRDAPPATRVRSFDAATGGRRAGGFGNFGRHGQEALAAAGTLRSRARHAEANDPLLSAACAAWVNECVGPGIRAVSQARDEALRPLIDGAWAAWSEVADAEERTDLGGLVAAAVRACWTDGESFLLIEEDADRLAVRLIPAEQVDESRTMAGPGDGYTVAGIEHDAQGRRTGYWVWPSRPTDTFAATYSEPVRVPARDVLHLHRPRGAGEVRGVPWAAPVLVSLNEYRQLSDALLVGQKVAALMAGFITSMDGTSGVGDVDLDSTTLEPGALIRLAAGEDVKFSSPQQAQQGTDFAKAMRREIAAGLGLPAFMLDGDLSDANYSSLRAGLQPLRRAAESFHRHQLVPQLLRPLWRRAMTREWLAERLDAPSPEALFPADFIRPAPLQVDPVKAAEATRHELELGLTSRARAAAERGIDVASLDAEIAADRARQADLGLSFGDRDGSTNNA